jgi:hypothetical protein
VKTRGLDLTLPAHSLASGPALGSEPVRGFLPGDFLLSRAHGRKHDVIRWGQGLRLQADDRHYAGYTHAALVVSPGGDLVEAIGEGVRASSLKKYVIDKEVYQVVRIEASAEARERVVEFAEYALHAKSPYDGLAIACTTFWAFTGSRLMFFMDGSFTCSGLVAAALERMGARFGMNAARVTPAQLAVFFEAPPPPEEAPLVSRRQSGRPRRRS